MGWEHTYFEFLVLVKDWIQSSMLKFQVTGKSVNGWNARLEGVPVLAKMVEYKGCQTCVSDKSCVNLRGNIMCPGYAV